MNLDRARRRVAETHEKRERSPSGARFQRAPVPLVRAQTRYVRFGVCWYTTNVLLVLAFLLAAYSAAWEYSTRRYLKGFSDAIVPQSSSDAEKVGAIIGWMEHGPTRREGGPAITSADRDPIDTLNYASLLRVCGSATNAFLNLAHSAGLAERRLLLIDSRGMTKHVVAEVFVDRRWIVVDPALRVILRGTNGAFLTREELANPAVLATATRDISGYSSAYTFDRTTHVRMARLPLLGLPLESMLNRILPGWEDSPALSLVLERESLATLVAAIALAALLGLLRIVLRWYGERRLGIRPMRTRQQIRQALRAFLETAT